jgi:integrase/recombinase XerC
VETGEAIANWLEAWGQSRPAGPLFVALDRAHRGHRLSGSGIYEIVRSRAEQVGIKKRLSPHRCRHSGITAALDATNGNVREVKKLSRHAKVETLLVYDDNRANAQGALSELLSEMV